MDISDIISKNLMNFITGTLNKSDAELEQIKYGIDSILANISKLIILFIPAYLIGIAKYTFIALISFGFIRGFASGIHATSSLKCIISNFVIFFGIVCLSLKLNLNNSYISLLFLVSLCLVLLYAPADTAAKPLTSKKVRSRLKIYSILAVIILYFITTFIKNNTYVNLITLSVFIEALLITPAAYKLFRSPYKNFEKFQ